MLIINFVLNIINPLNKWPHHSWNIQFVASKRAYKSPSFGKRHTPFDLVFLSFQTCPVQLNDDEQRSVYKAFCFAIFTWAQFTRPISVVFRDGAKSERVSGSFWKKNEKKKWAQRGRATPETSRSQSLLNKAVWTDRTSRNDVKHTVHSCLKWKYNQMFIFC